MSKTLEKQYVYTQSRELSWLRFNQRVLEEAADEDVPELEKLKFVSIFSSNLDEFFMVRVGSLFDIDHMSPDERDNKTGMTAKEQLHCIYRTVPGLIAMKEQIYSAVMQRLKQRGIEDVTPKLMNAGELKLIGKFFKTEMLPLLSPIIIGPHHPVPHLLNKHPHAAVLLEDKKGKQAVGIVPMPESLPPYILLPDGKRFVRSENILLNWAATLFAHYTVKEACIICVTRNADINFDDEKFEDNEESFRQQITKLLKRREYMSVVRLELSERVSEAFQSMLARLVAVEPQQIFIDTCPLNMSFVFELTEKLPKELAAGLLYRPYAARWPEDLLREQSIMAQVRQKDRLLFYPYDSVEPFIRLLNEAADDPNVLSIKITIYRLA